MVVLFQRRWSVAAGLVTGAVILFLLSGAVAGWDWPSKNLEIVRLADRIEAPQGFMLNL